MSVLIIILLVAALIITLLALVDFPAGSRLPFICVAMLVVIILMFLMIFGVAGKVAMIC